PSIGANPKQPDRKRPTKAEDCLRTVRDEFRRPGLLRAGWLGVSDLLGSFGYLLLTKGRKREDEREVRRERR
ncbi:hypothetical protein KY386_03995, partial [Candidatus Parcubacteria bacterium]|nr:hypothetical protein [Candidatus Parcubacteria bacterium]